MRPEAPCRGVLQQLQQKVRLPQRNQGFTLPKSHLSVLALKRIPLNLIQIEGNPRQALPMSVAVALHRLKPIDRNTL